MTPRERYWAAVNFKEPDRVPIDFGGLISTILDAGPNGYRGLCKHLGITDYDKPAVAYILNSVANIDERIYKRFNVDFRHVFPPNAEGPVKFHGDGTMTVIHGIRFKTLGDYYNPFDFPLGNMTKIKEIDRYPHWADPKNPLYWQDAGKALKDLHENTDWAVYALCGYWGMLGHAYSFLAGFDKWLADMAINPEFYKALMEKILSLNVEYLDSYYGQFGDYPDIILIGDDMGQQEGPFMSPKMFKEFMQPYMTKLVRVIKKNTKAKVMLHSCGSVYQLIPNFIECGIDILNPIQPLAKDMEAQKLKKDFYGKMVLHGGIDEQRLLAFGTKAEVIKGTKEYLKILAPGGGYIAAASHNIEPETKPEVVVAMFDTINEFGTYPIKK
ncbi:MAG: hypothetical protein FJ151_04420 [Euryarchaeota archaeon]|nr:hypothetical protein [Euryarchaeota archaeon]